MDSREAAQIEHETETKGVILGIDWNNAVQVRELRARPLTASSAPTTVSRRSRMTGRASNSSAWRN